MSSPSSLYKQLGMGAASPVSTSHLLLFVLGAGFLAFTVFVVHPNDFRIQSFFSGGCARPGTDFLAPAAPPPVKVDVSSASHAVATTPAPLDDDDVHVLIGIQTMPRKYERRHLLRTVYALQVTERPSLAGSVDVRFVFCNVTTPDDAVLVALEIMRYGDVIVLDCAENMDNGKTYDFFSTVARAFNGTTGAGAARSPPAYDYVMKADDDTYLRLEALVAALRGAAREDAYFGLEMPCDRENFYPFPPFMSGMGYALSWDLVRWVATSEVSRRDRVGPEDIWTGRWLNVAGKAKNRYDASPRMYNYRGNSPANCFRRDFMPDTIAVHMLKDTARWAETLTYFNATAALPPSNLYHLP